MHTYPNMSEKDLLTDLLNQEKQIMSSTAVYIQEASCENLRRMLTDQFTTTSQDEYQLFDQMRQKGYYPVTDADSAKVRQVKDAFRSMQSEL